MMGIFGWSYPPGCSGPPDMDEGPCEVCGNDVDNCVCPECERCGSVGDPHCYDDETCGMVRTQEQIDTHKRNQVLWEEEARATAEAEARMAEDWAKGEW